MTNVHVCNNPRLVTNFTERPPRVEESTVDDVSQGCGTVRIRLAIEDGSQRFIFNLWNVFHLPNIPSNLISLGLLNDAGIYYDNERQALYDKISQKPLPFARLWKTSFLLHPLNLSISAIKLFKAKDNIYQDAEPKLHETQSDKLPLTICQKRFGHLNFPALKKHLTHHNIRYRNDERVCNSCMKAKATKHYNCSLQERAKRPYQFIHSDLVGPITHIGSGAERYFVTFIDDQTHIIETYIGRQKSEWLKSLKAFYNLVWTR